QITFKETSSTQESRNKSKIKKSIFKNYKMIILNTKFLTYCYVTSLTWAGMGVYYMFLPFIIVNELHQNTIIFGWISFGMVISGVLGRIVNIFFISKRFTLEKTTIVFCSLAIFSSAILLLTLISSDQSSIIIIICSSMLFGFSSSIAAIAGSTVALNIFDKSLSATATAVYGLTLDLVVASTLAIAPLLATKITMMALMLIGLSGSVFMLLFLNQRSEKHLTLYKKTTDSK
ncbi:MAG: hypothetical protein ACJA0H_001605, partial [Francisellaceae bacterium]